MTDPEQTDALLVTLRAALAETEPVPAEVVAGAKGAYTWRTIDAELAELTFDSVLTGELAGTRGAVGTRTLSFDYGALAVELEVEGSGPTFQLAGQVAPRPPQSIEVHHVDDVEPLVAVPDRLGRFTVTGVRRGPIRLLLRFSPADGPAMLLTEWVTI